MLNNPNSSFNTKKSLTAVAPKRPRLSLSLHTMPKTVTSHWRKWLILGLSIVFLISLISILAFSFMN